MERTILGLNIVSINMVESDTLGQFKVIPSIANCKTMCKSPTVGYRSISEGGLVAGGIGIQQRRPTCFFTGVDPMNILMLTPRVEQGKPRMLPYTLKSGRARNAVYWFDLKLAQAKGLEFWQNF